MPRLSKIRITGNKYDGFQKQHRNSIFDLEADHTLFTLQNGSGKGVMLQLLSQLMLPGTAWGKRNGNKLEGMFYDRYQVFQPYTFHVVLEWRLDGEEDKKLLAGICVSAHKQQSTNDQAGKVGLKYFLYTHQYQGQSRFGLENLPLYTKSSDQVLEYDRLEEFIDQNRSDFMKFSKTAVSSLNSEYYQYLSSHGIYRSEWEIMKNINRSEGGLEKYFSQARDNKALFEQLIIPAVSESISYRGESERNSLINIFVDNIKIAENLPELISRTEDLENLDQMVKPLLNDAEQGLRLKKTKTMIRERGNNYLRGIVDRRTFLENELRRSESDLEATEKKIWNLNFARGNLKYVEKARELKKLKELQQQEQKQLEELQTKEAELKESRLQYQLNLEYLKYQRLQKEAAETQQKISNLKERSEFKEVEAEIEKIKFELKENYQQLKNKLQASTADYYSHQKYLKSEAKTLVQREKDLKNLLRDQERIIADYEYEKEKFEAKEKRLAQFFNPLQLETPRYLLEELKKKKDELEKQLAELNENLKREMEKEEKLKKKQQELEVKLAEERKDRENLAELYQQQNQEEEKIFSLLIKNLELDKFDNFYSKKWLQQQKNELLKLITEKKERLKQLNNQSFELQLDLNLNDQEYWVANHEQQKLYQKIKALNIRVYYGSEFLFELRDDREELLKKYPQLPYGLVVVYQSDWEKIEQNLSLAELMHYAVPIFINHQLDQEEVELPFQVLAGTEQKFIEDNQNFSKWYSGLKQKEAEIRETTSIVEGKINKLEELNYRAAEMLQQKEASELKTELDNLDAELEELQQSLQKMDRRLKNTAQNISFLEEKIDKKEKAVKEKENNLEEIEEFIEAKESLEQKHSRYQQAKTEIENLEAKLEKNNAQQRQNSKLLLQLDNDFDNWQQKLKIFQNQLQEILAEVETLKITESDERDYKASKNYPQFISIEESKAYQDFQKITDLQKKEAEIESELKYLRKDLQKTLAAANESEAELNQLAEDWEARDYDFSSSRKLKISLEEVVTQLQSLEAEIRALEAEINIRTGEINNQSRVLSEKAAEIKERFQRSVQSWEDVDLKVKELEIKKELSEAKDFQSKLKEMIINYKDKISHYSNLSNKLEYYQLESAKGELNAGIKDELKDDPAAVVDSWTADYENIRSKLQELRERTEENYYRFKNEVAEIVENKTLRSRINEKLLNNFRMNDYQYNFEMLSSFKEYLNNELNRIDEDKSEAERARSQWAERSALHVMRLITSMQEMINNMVYHNQRGYAFPLVRLRRSDLLPESEEEITAELKEYFLELLQKFKDQEIEVERLSDYQLKEYCGDAALFSRALRGRYPVLQVYKMTEKNEFLHAKPEDYFYSDWEAVIQGKGNAPEGSGGQSLSINAFMMMMLLNYKKQRFDRTNPWTVLFLDNPFGKASASHVLDPIFKIADKLNFQLVAFAAPEIIKTEISERFPVFWALEIADNQKNKGVVKGQVVSGERRRKME